MDNSNEISCFKNICKCKCKKDSGLIECCLCLIILFTAIISLSIIIYLISGLIILINDYDYSKDCNNSLLAIYVIVSLILVFKGCINTNNYAKYSMINLIILICQLLIDLGLIIWGGFELFNISSECNDLINSNLWKIGLASFIMQIVTFVIIVIIMLYLLCNIYSHNNKKIIDIETGEN